MCVLFYSQTSSVFSRRHTFLGHEYALIPFVSMCGLHKCLHLFLQLKILFSCEMDVYFLELCDSSSCSRLLVNACTIFLSLSYFQTRCRRCEAFQNQRMYYSLNMYTVCSELKSYKQVNHVTHCLYTSC